MTISELHEKFCQTYLHYVGFRREQNHFVFEIRDHPLMSVYVDSVGTVELKAGSSHDRILAPLIHGSPETYEFFISKRECELFGILTHAYQQVTARYNKNQTTFKVWPGCAPMAHLSFTLSKGSHMTTNHRAAVELLQRYHIHAGVALKRTNRTLTVGGSNG